MQYNLKKVFNFIKCRDILHLFFAAVILPWALIAKIFIRRFYLICEDENEARDNGYWLFKWIRQNRPDQKVAYAIHKNSPDYAKVKALGKVVSYGSAAHWFWYIVADKNISTQKGGKPNAAVCYLFEVVFKMRGNNRVFLQHGVIKDDMDWLYYKNTNMRMFVTSAQPEYDFLCRRYGYPEGWVKLLGLCRFDGLHGVQADKDLILVMPTWRSWLSREGRDNRGLAFDETQYCRQWNAFLNSAALHALLKQYDKRLIFYPHRNMQKFLPYFSVGCPRIEIADWREHDIQQVLKSAAVMVTDYSSVFFDFAYMGKPVIFWQFDEAEFRARQYAEGYFDYHNNVLGKWSSDLTGALALLEDSLKAGCPPSDEGVIRSFFPLWDENNCARTYEAIRRL